MKNNKERLSVKAIISFFIAFAVCAVLITITMLNRVNVEILTMEQIIVEKSMKITDVISKLIYKTQTLSVLVIQNDGHIEDFDKVANIIVDDPAILNVLIAPDGVVTNVFPAEGNETVVGLDFFAEGAGNREAVIAKEKGELVLGGPFNLVQGGKALVGRLPVYLESSGVREFWGLVSVTLKYPQALERAELDSLKTMGLAYEIWRTSPDTNEKQIIAGSGYSYNKKAHYVEKKVTIANADWYFRILPIRSWYQYPELWLMIFLSLFASLIVSFIVQNNYMLSFLRVQLEEMANTDPLLGIYNRRFFMEVAHTQVERSARADADSFIVIFDLDHFKDINDKYGHLAGDKALVDISRKVKSMLRTYDLFARYGGEEFVILVTDISKRDIGNFVERIRKGVCEMTVEFEDKKIAVSASFGVAPANNEISFEDALKLADESLYKAKREGRNRVVFYDSKG